MLEFVVLKVPFTSNISKVETGGSSQQATPGEVGEVSEKVARLDRASACPAGSLWHILARQRLGRVSNRCSEHRRGRRTRARHRVGWSRRILSRVRLPFNDER